MTNSPAGNPNIPDETSRMAAINTLGTSVSPIAHRIPLTRKKCLGNFFSSATMMLCFAAFAWKGDDRGPDWRWINAIFSLMMLNKVIVSGRNYLRLRKGQTVTIYQRSRRTDWGIWLTFITFILGLAMCQILGTLVNHPHAPRPQHFLLALVPLWVILIWAWRHLPKDDQPAQP